MKSILRITLTAFLLCLQICSSIALQAQCKVDTSDPVKGEFSINGTKVLVNGDGGGVATATNNTPIKICEGELISLKSTLAVTAQTSVVYWIVSNAEYLANPRSIQSSIGSVAGSYSSVNGSVDLRLIEKSSYEPQGLSFYNGPGKYVIVQYDNSTSTTTGPGVHHACQVIEIIKPVPPVATVTSCTINQFDLEFPQNSKNIFDDYEITFNALVGNYNPILKTGKPKSYPFSVNSGSLLTDNQNRIITIKGVSVTGGCNAPITNLGVVALNNTVKPSINSLKGSIQKGEFKLLSEVPVSMPVNVYIRDPQTSSEYDYKSVFKTYLTRKNLGTDSVKLVVPNADKQYCFTTGADDTFCPSNNYTTKFKSLQEVCTMTANVEVLKNKNVITWSRDRSQAEGSKFRIYYVNRNKITNGQNSQTFQMTNIDSLKYVDSDITCNDEYLYNVVVLNNQASYSQNITVKADASYASPKIPNVVASIRNDKYAFARAVYSNTIPSDLPKNVLADKYKFYRANALNDNFKLIYTGNTSFVDSTTEADKKQYCYYVTNTNNCNIESEPSDKVCSINLKLNQGEIEWTKENTHVLATNYELVLTDTLKKISNSFKLENTVKSLNLKEVIRYYLNPGDARTLRIVSLPTNWYSGNNYLPSSVSNPLFINFPPLANEQEEDSSINIYPNPSQEIITIDLKNEKPEIVNWILHNQIGQIINQSISNKPTINYQSQIDIKNLQKGVYLLKIDSGEKSAIRKIVKE
jgi:hypothetical protein